MASQSLYAGAIAQHFTGNLNHTFMPMQHSSANNPNWQNSGTSSSVHQGFSHHIYTNNQNQSSNSSNSNSSSNSSANSQQNSGTSSSVHQGFSHHTYSNNQNQSSNSSGGNSATNSSTNSQQNSSGASGSVVHHSFFHHIYNNNQSNNQSANNSSTNAQATTVSAHHTYGEFVKAINSGNLSSTFHNHSAQYLSLYPHAASAQSAIWSGEGKTNFVHASSTALSSAATGNLNSFGLDLNSTRAIIPAGITQPVTILVGGTINANGDVVGARYDMVIHPGQLLTPAQYAAMQQVISSGGQQTLIVNSAGAAVKGTLTLTASQTAQVFSGAFIPKGVTVDAVGFSSKDPLDIAGSAKILGSLVALQTSGNTAATIDTGSLVVGSHGSVTDIATSQNLLSNLLSSSGLSLYVINSVINAGSITSASTLSIQSGGSITNISSSSIMSGATVNLSSATGSFHNAGTITATAGNVNFNAPVNQALTINNTGGTVQAAQNIDVRESSFNGSTNMTLNGGNWLSQQLNLNDGSGAVTANLDNVTGAVSTTAQTEHFSADTSNLILGGINVSGDPSYFNTGGKVTIASDLVFSGEDLAIVAKTNIVTAAGAGIISTSSSTGNGGNITMIAGANFTSSGAARGHDNKAATLTITGGTSAGGYIDLNGNVSGSGVGITSLTSASSAAGGSGGNITLVAYGGTGNSAGQISLPTSITVASGGTGSGSNGSVTAISGASSGTGISIGNVDTTGGKGGGGNIALLTATPIIFSSSGTMTIKNGAITNGASFAALNSTAASITAGNLTSPGGSVTVAGGTNVATGSITSNGVGTNGSGGNIYLSASHDVAGSLQVNGDISANGVGHGQGGTIYMFFDGATSSSLLIGSSNSASNYVSGNISANSGGTGTVGGNIYIASLAPNPLNMIPFVENPLNIALTSTISAATSGSSLGNVTFTGQTVSVTGAGGINAIVNNNSDAGAVTYNVASGNLTLGYVSNASGNITVTDSNINGTVLTTQSIASAGQLTITTGSAGSITANTGNQLSGTAVSLTAGSGGITFEGTSGVSTNSSTGNAGNISIIASDGAISFGTGSVTAEATGASGSGGVITIEGLSVTANNQINASAANAGNGGTINVESLGSSSNLTANGTYDARGGVLSGNGGTVNLSAGQNLLITSAATINVGSRAANGNGGTISLTNGLSTAGTLQIDQSLSANGTGSGIGGQILISANSNSVFLISGTSGNGVTGTLTATGGSGGIISITNRGSGGITLLKYSDISVAALGAGGGAGGSIILNANSGLLTIPAGTINASAIGPGSFNGGSISLTGSSIALSGGTGTTLSLLANGAGSGNGGSISVRTTGATGDITLGSAAGDITLISATGGSIGSAAGNGGTITLNAGRNVFIPNTPNIITVSPLGNNGNGGTISLTNGSVTTGTMQIQQSLNANGSGNGSGGQILISNNSNNVFLISGVSNNGINGILTAAGGNGVGGSGGTVSVTNVGSGGITLVSYSDISVAPSLGGGAGGHITLNANYGLLTIPAGTMNTSAVGPGSYNGGSISLTGSSVALNGGTGVTLSLLANGFGTGNGGSVYVHTTSATGDITLGNAPGNIASISATGGSLGSSAGNGGSVTLIAGRNLIIPSTPNIVNVSPLGFNGNGGSISLTAGSALSSTTNALLQVNQSLNANGAGTGNGGTIYISYHDATNPFYVGSPVPNSFSSYVSGQILANAGASGANGGTVTIANTAAGPLNVSLGVNGNILAGGTNLGYINFVPASGQSISVAGTAFGNGNLVGIVNATGASVYINPQAANTILTTGTIGSTASSGFVMLGVNNGNSTINLDGAITTNGGALSILSTGNIGSAGSAQTSTAGGAITLIAGGAFTTSPSTDTFTVTGPSTFGGSLNLNSFSSLSTAVSSGNTNGGNVTLIAYNGTNASAGEINLPSNVTITSGGNGTGSDGSVTVISGAISGSGINIGGVNTTGGQGGGGNITLATAVPLIVSTNGTVAIQNGAITNGGSFAAGNINPVSITTGSLTATAGVITVTAGTTITANGNITSATNTVTLFTNVPTGSISIGSNTVSGGEGVSVTTATLNLGNSAAIIAVNNDLTIQGNGSGNSLTINIPGNGAGPGAFLEALNPTTGNVVFNSVGEPGSITISPLSYTGLDINAGSSSRSIIFNGGTYGVISIPMIHAETGLVYADGASVTIGVNNGLTVQNVTASSGAVSLAEGGSAPGQNLTVYGTVSAATTVSLFEQYSSGVTTIGPGALVIGGTGVSVTTPNLTLGSGSAIVAVTNNLIIQGNGSGNSLAINIPTTGNAPATLEALDPTTGNVVFNSVSQPGSISISQSYTGLDINAGSSSLSITFNGGTNGVVNIPMIHSETGLVYANGASVTIGVNNGLTVQNVTASTGAVSLTEGGSAPGQNLTIYGNVSAATTASLYETYSSGVLTLASGAQVTGGTGVSITTPNLNLGSGSAITAARNNVSIQSDGSGHALSINEINSGSPTSITATLGDVIFNSPGAPGPITINQNSGTINISAHNGAGSVAFNGGTTGAVTVDVNSINGKTTGLASSVSLVVASGKLYVDNWTTTTGGAGFYNLNGNIDIAGTISASGQSLAIIASADIRTLGATTISTSSGTGNGGTITMMAGAASTLSGNNVVTVTGASTTGGSIRFSSNDNLDSDSSASTGNGGNVLLIAFAGSSPHSGGIVSNAAAPVNINSGGSGSGVNGNVSLIAGGSGFKSIANVGDISTVGGTGGGGNINLITATPIVSAGGIVFSNGSINSGSVSAGTLQKASISVGTLTAPGAAITVTAGRSALTGSVTDIGLGANPGGTFTLTERSSSTLEVQNGATNGVNGTINVSGGPNAGGSGGTIVLTNKGTGGIDITNGSNIVFAPGAGGGAGGKLTLNAGNKGTLTISNGTLNANAAGPGNYNGGRIDLHGSTINVIGGSTVLTANGVGSGNGGNILVETKNGNITLGGFGNISAISATGGSSDGSTGGNVTVSAGGSLTLGSTIDVASTAANGNGGSITLAAGSAVPGSTLQAIFNGVSGTNLNTSGSGTGTGGNIALVSSGNILLDDTNNAPGIISGGGQINIVAGAAFATHGSKITITGASSTGGYITAMNGNTPITSAGGNVLMVAYAGSGSLSGGIGINDALPITTGSTGSGVNGNVTIIAGGSSPSFVNLSTINTVGGSGGGGNVTVEVATPVINGGSLSIQHGAIISGSVTDGALQSGNLSITSVTTAAGNVTIAGGGYITTGPITTTSGNIFVYDASTANNSLVLGKLTTSTGDITLASQTVGYLNISQDLATVGGDIALISGGQIRFTTPTSSIDTNGGSLTIISGAAFSRSAETTVSVTGANNTNGSITFSTGGTTLSTANNAVDGDGGKLIIAAFAGTSGIASINAQETPLTINTGGNGSGTNGNVQIVFGDANPATNSYLGNINTVGGAGGGGNVYIAKAEPVISNGPLTILNGGIISGSITPGVDPATNIVTGSITTSTGNVTILGGNNITTGAISTGTEAPFSSPFGSSGSVIITSTGGALFLDTVSTNGLGAGNFAGSITLSAPVGITMGNINANGYYSSTSGNINITTPGQISGTFINADGSLGGAGGTITTVSGTLSLSGINGYGNSIDASSGGGNAGSIFITTTSSQTFTVGGSSVGNAVPGDIAANGYNGGFVSLTNYGNQSTGNQVINGAVQANGSFGQGGEIIFQSQQPAGSGPLITTINGLVQATNIPNNSGIIGFSGGPGQNISLLGSGSVQAGQVVRVGNLNPTTLAFQSPSAGNIFISPSLRISNLLEPSSLRPTSTISSSANVPNYEDISRTAVDDTPFHRFPYIDLYKEPIYQLAASRYNLVTIPGTKVFNHTFEGAQLSQLVKNGLVLASNTQANRLDIDKGNALVAPDKEVIIGTHEADIRVSPGAIVFVMEDGADVVLYGLSQNNSKQVSVTLNANKHQLFLEPGLMLVLTRQNAHKFEDIDADCHYVSYRNAKMLNIDEKDIKVFMANFSTSSAVVNIEPLQQMLVSSDKKDKLFLDQIAKSAVIMGGFHTELEPPSTQIAGKQPNIGSADNSQNNPQATTQPIHPPMQIGTSGQVIR